MLLDTHPDLYKEKKMILIQIITYEPGKVDERKQEMIKRNIQEIIDKWNDSINNSDNATVQNKLTKAMNE